MTGSDLQEVAAVPGHPTEHDPNSIAALGLQTLTDGEPYVKLSATGPGGRPILELMPKSNLKIQGMSDFFFGSAEPSLDEVPLQAFLERFPEGIYEFETITLEGMGSE